jgi:amino acid transporter
VIFYGVPILLILLVLPPSRLSNVFGFVDAMKQVFVVYGGHVTSNGVVLSGAGTVLADIGAVGVIFGLLSSGVIWLIGSDRTQAVAGFDGAAPRWMGYFSKRLGTPIAVNLLSGVVATIILILSLQLTSGNTAKYFSATLGLVISMVTFTYVLIFPAVIKLRYSHPDVERPYRIPGGMAVVWICGLLAAAWCLLTTLAILWPGIGTSDPDASLPEGFGGQRLQYELSQIIPLVVMILIGLAFYASGAKTRREQVAPAGVPVGAAAGATGAAVAAPAADPAPASPAEDTASAEASPAADGASPAAGEADGASASADEAAAPASTDGSES